MQITFEFAIYDEENDTFSLDEQIYSYELDEEEVQKYETLKAKDLHVYSLFKNSEAFYEWLKEEVYPDSLGKKIAICNIAEISFRRFYFFKVTSGDEHYEYFKDLFHIFHESDWQDREEVGEQILQELRVKRQELLIEISGDEEDDEVMDNADA